MALTSALQQFALLKQFVDSGKYVEAEAPLNNLKLIMLDLDSLPPVCKKSSTSEAELQLFKQVLEYASIQAVGIEDKAAFARNIGALRPYYPLLGKIELSQSPLIATVLGLNLLYLIVENRLADFHCELETFSSDLKAHPFISFCVLLEQHLVVGSYDEVLIAAANPPSPLYSFFLAFLLETVRLNIGDCIAASYESISLPSIAKLLKFESIEETKLFVEQIYPNWTLSGDRYLVNVDEKISKADEIPSHLLISQSLSYATELERIV